METAYTKGIVGEKIAQNYLQNVGYFIIQNRYYCKYGEIDIIAIDIKKNYLVFIEVKRRKKYNDAIHAISNKKMNRIFSSALSYIANNEKFNNFDLRFDFILIIQSKRDQFAKVVHINNALQIDLNDTLYI